MPVEIDEIRAAVEEVLRSSGDDAADDSSAAEPVKIAAAGKVSVGGRDYINSISRIKLVQTIDDHHRAAVRLNFSSSDSPTSRDLAGLVGEQITIRVGQQLFESDSQFPIAFAGVVTGLKMVTEAGSDDFAVIIAHSPTIKMENGRLNNTFANQKASDMISSAFGGASLGGGTIDASSVVYDQMFQYEETHWDFVKRMASSYGVFLFYDGEKAHATNAKSRPTNTIAKSDFGSLKLTLGATPNGAMVQGWDYKEKKEIVGSANGTDASGMDSRESSTLRKSNSVHPTMDYMEAGNALSKAHADTIAKTLAMSYIQDLAHLVGQTRAFGINIGKNIKVEGFGQAMDGTYFVTEVTHEFDTSGQYSNRFAARPTNSAYPRVAPTPLRETALQIGIVTNIEDEDDLGRVKVKFPWRSGEESFWARMAHVDAGTDKGLYTLPDVDDEVIVGFEFGDFNRPVILGNLYNGKDRPIRPGSEMVDGGISKLKVFKTKGGNEIVLDDTSGAEVISIIQKDGTNSIILTMDGPSISIVSDGGDINIKGKAINIESESGDIALKSGGKITTESQADTQIKATGALKAEGMNAEIKGQTNGKFEAGAMLDLKGNAMVNVKGGMINLN